jgi:hypothetical protein
MKTKVLSFSFAFGLLALAAWRVHVPNPAQADEIPEKYRQTVRKGLEFLVKNQREDGHWEGDGGNHPVAMTGLAALALLMDKDDPVSGAFVGVAGKARHPVNLRKTVDWLLAKSQSGRDGLIFSDHPSETARYMEGHGLATLFLAGACKDEKDEARRKKLTDFLTRAVKYILQAQSTQGGWYHTSKAEGHDFDSILPTVIQIQALQAAEYAGIPVPSGAIHDGQEYLKTSLGKHPMAPQARPSDERRSETAAALACRFRPGFSRHNGQLVNGEMNDELCKTWFEYCKAKVPLGRDIKFDRDAITHYYYAQAMINLRDDTWKNYRAAMFDHLQSSQGKDGAWPASDGISTGQVYSTALWCTILQLDNRSHPCARARFAGDYITLGFDPASVFKFATKPV